MSSIKNLGESMDYVLRKFPSRGMKIIAQQSVNPDFRQLIEDLYTITKDLEALEGGILADLEKKDEYQNLVKDLENELIKFLDRSNSHK